jgi:hypothetical protein
MANEPEWAARIEREEEALLERCQTFVLASPHSPGGGDKDILYLTPCGRWIRVSSRVAYYRDEDQGPGEVCKEINSNAAGELFLNYGRVVPPQVPESPQRRDIEMAQYLESLRPPGSDGSSSRMEVSIERNALLQLLRTWAEDWPLVIEPAPQHSSTTHDSQVVNEHLSESLNVCEVILLKFFYKGARRMVREIVFQEIQMAGYEGGRSTLFNALSRLKKMKYFDNIQRPNSKGYQITDKGKHLAQTLG